MLRRPAGQVTRGKTAPNRLRLVDTYLLVAHAERLRAATGPLVDVGFGETPVTTVELFQRVRRAVPAARVIGLEIDPERAAAAQAQAREGLIFLRGGFELPLPGGELAGLVRAFNVLRQYDEGEVRAALRTMAARMAPGALLIEGTSDPFGRLACWWTWERTAARPGPAGTWDAEPLARRWLVFGARIRSLTEGPRAFQPYLPKELIHHAEPGGLLDRFFAVWERAWLAAAGRGPRERWIAAAWGLAEAAPVDRRRGLIGRGIVAVACDRGPIAEVLAALS